MVFAEGEVHPTALGYALGIVRRLRVIREKAAHLLLGFDIEFLGLKAHPVGVLHGLLGLDAHEHVLGAAVLLREVVGVIGEDQG